MNRIGMNMLLWSPDVSDARFDALFDSLAGLGYEAIEVPIFALEPGLYADLGRRLSARGLEPLALTARGPEANVIDADPAVRARGVADNLLALDCAAALGATIVCGPFLATPCVFSGAPPTDDERAWAVDAFRTLAERADADGITLALESLNHFEHYLANTAAQTAELCRAADHPRARMVYDSFHAHLEEKDVWGAIAGCADVLAYVHLSENDRSTPGSGQVDWDATFDSLRSIGYAGWLTVEAFACGDPQMRIWRQAYSDDMQIARDAIAFVRSRLR